MRLTIGFLIFFIGAIVEVTLLNTVEILSVKPNLFLIAVIFMALFWGRSPAMWFGFASGIFLDLFTPQHMGLNALLLASTGFLLGSLATSLYRDKYVSQVLILLTVSAVESVLYFAFSSGSFGNFLLFFLRYGIGGSLYTTAVGAAIFYGIHVVRVRWITA